MSWDICYTNYLVFQNAAGYCCSQLSRNFSRSRLNIVMNDIAIVMVTWQQKWSLEVYGTIWMNDVFANWIFILENCKMMAIWIDVAHLNCFLCCWSIQITQCKYMYLWKCTSKSFTKSIVNRGEWLWNPLFYLFVHFFQPRPGTKQKHSCIILDNDPMKRFGSGQPSVMNEHKT